MRVSILLFLIFVAFCECFDISRKLLRAKRDAVGALHIVTNNAQPIHEDVKPESEPSEKPCPKDQLPSKIEMGTVFQVVPAQSVWVEGQSLRKSSPLTTRLDLVRSINRVITLFVLLLSGILEFYPMLQQLYNIIYSFMYA